VEKYAGFRDKKTSSKEKDLMLVEFAYARRNAVGNKGKTRCASS